MTIFSAAGWTFAITFFFILLRAVTLGLRPGSTDDMVSQIGCQAIAYLFGLFLILRVHAPEASIRETIGLRRTSPGFYLLAILLGVAIELPADALYLATLRRFPTGVEDRLPEVFHGAATLHRALIVAALVVAGPAIEEVLFRGALFRPLLKSSPAELVILVTSALFAVVHLEWQMLLPIGFVGLSLAFLRRRSGSIIPSFLAHGSFNAVSVVLLANSEPGAPADGASFPPAVVAVSAGVALALVGAIHLLGGRSTIAEQARELDLQ